MAKHPCLLNIKGSKNLESHFSEIDENLPESEQREKIIELSKKYHEKLFNDLKNLKKEAGVPLKVKDKKYVAQDNTKAIAVINKEYDTKVSETRLKLEQQANKAKQPETVPSTQSKKEEVVKVKLGDKLKKGETVLWKGKKHEVVKQNSDGTLNIKADNGEVTKEILVTDKEFGGKVVTSSTQNNTLSGTKEAVTDKTVPNTPKSWKDLILPPPIQAHSSSSSSAPTVDTSVLVTEKGFNSTGKGIARIEKIAAKIKDPLPSFNKTVRILKKLIPSLVASNIKLYIHPDSDSMKAAMSKKGYSYDNNAAFFVGDEIHIDLSNANQEVPVHEIIHPILNKILESNPELYKSFAKELEVLLTKGDKEALKAEGFSENYKGDSQKMDEMIVQYVANKVSNSLDLGETQGIVAKFKQQVKDVLTKFGLSPYKNILANDITSLDSFAKTLASGIKTGFTIKSKKETPPTSEIQYSKSTQNDRNYRALVKSLISISLQYKESMPTKAELKKYAVGELGYSEEVFEDAYTEYKFKHQNTNEHLKLFSDVTKEEFDKDIERVSFNDAVERGLNQIPDLGGSTVSGNLYLLAQKLLAGEDVHFNSDLAAVIYAQTAKLKFALERTNENLQDGIPSERERLLTEMANLATQYETLAAASIQFGRIAARGLAYRAILLNESQIKGWKEDIKYFRNRGNLSKSDQKALRALEELVEVLEKNGTDFETLLKELKEGTYRADKHKATQVAKGLTKTPSKSAKSKISALNKYVKNGSFVQSSKTENSEDTEESVHDRRRIVHDLSAIVASEMDTSKLTLEELAEKINEFIVSNEYDKADFPIEKVSVPELVDTLSRSHPDSKKVVLSEGAKALKSLRDQAKTLKIIEDIFNKSFSKSETRKKNQLVTRSEELKNTLNYLKNILDQTSLSTNDRIVINTLYDQIKITNEIGVGQGGEHMFEEARKSFNEYMDKQRLKKLEEEAKQLEKDLDEFDKYKTSNEYDAQMQDLYDKYNKRKLSRQGRDTQKQSSQNAAYRAQIKERLKDYSLKKKNSVKYYGLKTLKNFNNIFSALLLSMDYSVTGTFGVLSLPYVLAARPEQRKVFFTNLKHAARAWGSLLNIEEKEFKDFQKANEKEITLSDGTKKMHYPTYADFVNHQFDEFIKDKGVTEEDLAKWDIQKPFDLSKEDDLSVFKNFKEKQSKIPAAMVRSNAALALYIAQMQVLDNKKFKDDNPTASETEIKDYANKVKWFTFRPPINIGVAGQVLLAPRYKIAGYANLLRSPSLILQTLFSRVQGKQNKVAEAAVMRYLAPFAIMSALYMLAAVMQGGYDLEDDWTDKDFLKLVKYLKGSKGMYSDKDPLFVFGRPLRFLLGMFHSAAYNLRPMTGVGLEGEYATKLSNRFGDAFGEEKSAIKRIADEAASWLSPAASIPFEVFSQAAFGGTRVFNMKDLDHPFLTGYISEFFKKILPLSSQAISPPVSPLDTKANLLNVHERWLDLMSSPEVASYLINIGVNFLGIKSQFDYKPYLDPRLKDLVNEKGIKLNPNSDEKDPYYKYFKEENNNPFRDFLKARVAVRMNIWFNEEKYADTKTIADKVIPTGKGNKKTSELENKFKEISAEEREAIMKFAIDQIEIEGVNKLLDRFQK